MNWSDVPTWALIVITGVHFWSRWTQARETDASDLGRRVTTLERESTRSADQRHQDANFVQGLQHRISVEFDQKFVTREMFNWAIEDSKRDRASIREALEHVRRDLHGRRGTS